jgi:hypothetical protein
VEDVARHSLAFVALARSTSHAGTRVVGQGILLSGSHLLEAARHCPLLLLEMIRVLAWRWLEVRLHRHSWLETLVRSLVRHHRWPWAALESLVTMLLHVMRHMWLGMRWHWREVLGHWSVGVTS